MSRAAPSRVPCLDQLPEPLQAALTRFAVASAGGPFGASPFAHLVATHRSLFDGLRRLGATWDQIAALLTAQGVTVRGAPVTQGALRATVSRAAKSAAKGAAGDAQRSGSKRDAARRNAVKRAETKRHETKRGETNRSSTQRNDPARNAAKRDEPQGSASQSTAAIAGGPAPRENAAGLRADAANPVPTNERDQHHRSISFATGAAELMRRAALTQKPPQTR